MEIPVLTRFIKGLKLFLESKRLRWLTIVFIIGAIFIIAMREINNIIGTTGVIAVLGGIIPTFFLLTALVSIIGLQRFIASEETYSQSIIYFLPWIVVSAVVYVVIFFVPALFSLIYFWIAFFGWIVLQAYLASRSSLRYAESVEVQTRSKAMSALFGIMNLAAYVIIIGAFLVFAFLNLPELLAEVLTIPLALIGAAFALGFNFLNGLLIVRYRNKVAGENLAVLGLFIALYVAYFEYSVLKPIGGPSSIIDALIDIAVSVFFILYAMSSVGLTLASRAEMDTRLKISKELAATLTFFLASGYMVVEAFFETINPLLGRAPELIKLALFPLVALLMALLLIRRAGRAPKPEPMPEDAPVIPDEVQVEEEPAETEEEPIEPEEEYIPPPEEEFLEEESPENQDLMDTTEDDL